MVVYFRPHLENLVDQHYQGNEEESGKLYVELCMKWIKETFPDCEIILEEHSIFQSKVENEDGNTNDYLTGYLWHGLENIYNDFEWEV